MDNATDKKISDIQKFFLAELSPVCHSIEEMELIDRAIADLARLREILSLKDSFTSQ